jgi:hypothetical protein
MARPKRKTEVTTLKMTPEVRSLWGRCAEAEVRTLTNMFEVMVRAYARKVGITAEAPVAQTAPTAALPAVSSAPAAPSAEPASPASGPTVPSTAPETRKP